MLSLQYFPVLTSEKRLLNLGTEKDDLGELYLLPFKALKEVKLSMFRKTFNEKQLR